MWNLIVNGRMGSVFAGDSHVVRYWRPQIQGTVTENLPSTAEAYQICKCSMRSTFPIPRTSLMTIPSPLDLANNVVKNKHFSGISQNCFNRVQGVKGVIFSLIMLGVPRLLTSINEMHWIKAKKRYKLIKK